MKVKLAKIHVVSVSSRGTQQEHITHVFHLTFISRSPSTKAIISSVNDVNSLLTSECLCTFVSNFTHRMDNLRTCDSPVHYRKSAAFDAYFGHQAALSENIKSAITPISYEYKYCMTKLDKKNSVGVHIHRFSN